MKMKWAIAVCVITTTLSAMEEIELQSKEVDTQAYISSVTKTVRQYLDPVSKHYQLDANSYLFFTYLGQLQTALFLKVEADDEDVELIKNRIEGNWLEKHVDTTTLAPEPQSNVNAYVQCVQAEVKKYMKEVRTTHNVEVGDGPISFNHWFRLFKAAGRLEGCIHLGLISDPSALENITSGIEEIREAFKLNISANSMAWRMHYFYEFTWGIMS